jgi:hypothetical protein
MKHLLEKVASATALVVVSIIATTEAVSAEGDLYFMHNGSPFFVWTDRDDCVNDMRNNSNQCVTFRVCGNPFASTEATLNVANDMYNRNQPIVVRTRYVDGIFCTVKK